MFWLPAQLRSGVGLCLRHQGEKHIATLQAATTGILSAQYAHRVTDKVRREPGCCVCLWCMCGTCQHLTLCRNNKACSVFL